MRHITLLIMLAVTVSGGCRSYPKAAPIEERVEAVSPENADALRAAYQQQYPGSQLGVVVAALNHAHSRYVAVGGLPVDQMADGQVVTFMDARQKPLTTGVIVTVLADSVHVRLDDPPPGSRQPRAGDLMIRF